MIPSVDRIRRVLSIFVKISSQKGAFAWQSGDKVLRWVGFYPWPGGKRIREVIDMFFVLFALWLVFNGKVTLEIALFGIGVSLIVYLFCWKFLEYSPKKELLALRLLPQGIGYFFVLVCEVVKANCSTISLIVSPKYEVEPFLVTFRNTCGSH